MPTAEPAAGRGRVEVYQDVLRLRGSHLVTWLGCTFAAAGVLGAAWGTVFPTVLPWSLAAGAAVAAGLAGVRLEIRVLVSPGGAGIEKEVRLFGRAVRRRRFENVTGARCRVSPPAECDGGEGPVSLFVACGGREETVIHSLEGLLFGVPHGTARALRDEIVAAAEAAANRTAPA